MKKEEFYFDSRSGSGKMHAVRYSPDDSLSKGQNLRCVLQIVHGMAEYVERYEEFARFLTERGFVVTGEDHMGHGKSVGEDGQKGFFCEKSPEDALVENVQRLKELTQAVYPNVPYVVMGHSMGSFITRNYMFRHGGEISGAIIMGTGMQPRLILGTVRALTGIQKVFCGSKHTARLIDKLAFGGYNKNIKNPKTAWDWLSRDEKKVAQYMADSGCGFTFTVNGFGALFGLIARLYEADNLKHIPKKLPVFMASGTDDPVGDYGKGVRKAYDSLMAAGMENVTLRMYEGGRHELLNETNRSEIMQDIYDWMECAVLGGKAGDLQ